MNSKMKPKDYDHVVCVCVCICVTCVGRLGGRPGTCGLIFPHQLLRSINTLKYGFRNYDYPKRHTKKMEGEKCKCYTCEYRPGSLAEIAAVGNCL